MYDPLELSLKIEKYVVNNNFQRKYYRFRGAKYYGGISTADVVGCNLNCVFCWVHPKIRYRIKDVGKFYKPEIVAEKLASIARKANFRQLRISGGEPTIGEDHLICLIECLEKYPYRFILETNGILLASKDYVKKLSNFNNLYVRVSLKAGSPETFSKVTGAIPKAYYYPLQALKNLINYGVPCHASVIIDFCKKSEFKFLTNNLQNIDPILVTNLEFESLILYPHVKKGLKKIGYKIE